MMLASLRAQIGIVTQETVLFDDSIAANIAYGQPAAPSYGEPAAPSYGEPPAPAYGQPGAYGQPTPYGQPGAVGV